MTTFKRFEEIEAWQLAREIAFETNELVNLEPLIRNYSLKDQMRRSSGSMMDNIAEGFGRASQFEFVQFLSIGLGSASELKSQLYRVLDLKAIEQSEFNERVDKIERYGKMVGGLINYLNKSDVRGLKFKDRRPYKVDSRIKSE